MGDAIKQVGLWVFEPGIVWFNPIAVRNKRPPRIAGIVSFENISLVLVVLQIAHFDGTPIPEPPPRPFFGWHGDMLTPTVTRNDVLNKFHALKAQRWNLQAALRPAHRANVGLFTMGHLKSFLKFARFYFVANDISGSRLPSRYIKRVKKIVHMLAVCSDLDIF
jgi:hypothetical protein